jgi:hypothetical protein
MATNTRTAKDVDLRQCAGVGQGISKPIADDVRKQIERMPTTRFYQQKDALAYPFEALDSNAIGGVVKPVVDAWLNVRAYSYANESLFLIILRSRRTTKTLDVSLIASESQIAP